MSNIRGAIRKHAIVDDESFDPSILPPVLRAHLPVEQTFRRMMDGLGLPCRADGCTCPPGTFAVDNPIPDPACPVHGLGREGQGAVHDVSRIEADTRKDAFLSLVLDEIDRVDAKLGVDQDAPCGDGTSETYIYSRNLAQDVMASTERSGTWSWISVLREEFFEVCSEVDTTKIQTELVQVASVCFRWWRAIERRKEHNV